MDEFRNFKTPRRATASVEGFVSSGRPAVHHSRPSKIGGEVVDRPKLNNFKREEGFKRIEAATTIGQKAAVEAPVQRKGLIRMADIDISLSDEGKKKKRGGKGGKRNWRKIITRSLAVFLALSLILVGLLFAKGYLKLRNVFRGGGNAPALSSKVDITKLRGEGDGRINVLLMGIGGAGHDGADLTDTMMLASIDPVNNKAALLSIPRDTWVKMPNNFIANEQKINAAYESGKYAYLGKQDSSNGNRKAIEAGFAGVDKVVEETMGVPVHYNLLVNFKAFQQAVDTVNGVTVNVPEQLYDPTMAWENNWNPVLAKAGTQNFDGKRALMYVRSRETSSDFARSQRQRAVIVALKDKVFSLNTLSNPAKISNLMSAFGDNVQSDISIADASRMLEILKKIPNNDIQSVGLTDGSNKLVTTANIKGLSAVVPTAGNGNFSLIQAYVRNMLKDGFIQNENANIAVYNGSGVAGLAGTKATELRSYGYNVVTVANAPTSAYANTVLVDLTKGVKKYTKHYLEQRLKVTATTTMPDASINTAGADFVIILGKDASVN